MDEIEGTGEKFNLRTFLEARRICREAVEEIASKVQVGMNEADGQALIKDVFAARGITKFWHPSKFRVGSETVKSFKDLADQNVRLENGDIFFLDVGPIYQEHEADYGRSFALGENAATPFSQALAQAAEKVWEATAKRWEEDHLSGEELYAFAQEMAEGMGFELNLNPHMSGHRLGDFPHALFSKDSLKSIDFSPTPNLWVLEIHLVSPRLKRGAFYEDILRETSL